MLDHLPKYVFMVAYTLSHINHPYLIYFNLDDTFINVLLPIGREYQQANTEEYIHVINSIVKTQSSSNKSKTKQTKKTRSHKSRKSSKSIIYTKENIEKLALLTAIYVLLDNTIKTRKYGILFSKFSILTCENMTLCIHKITEISKMTIKENEKQNLYINIHYKHVCRQTLHYKRHIYLIMNLFISLPKQYLMDGRF